MTTVSVHVVPNASQNEVVGWYGGALKIRLAAAPSEGRANDALCRFLGKVFMVAPSTIEIERGAGSKKKRVRLPISEADLKEEVARYLSRPGSKDDNGAGV